MILGTILGEATHAQPQQGASRVTIDEIFRRVAQRRPEALALVDAPNRKTFTDGAPRRLTFAQADRMVSAIAGRLRHMQLPTDAIVGIQLPNIVENILAILGVMRAGMIAAPLAAVVAPRRCGCCAHARRRQGADHYRPCRQLQSLSARHARCGRRVFDPLCLRLWRRPARRRRAVRRFVHGRKARPGAGARSRTGEQSGRPPCRHHLRRRRRRHRAGGAQSSAIAGRRPWRAAGKPAGAGRDHAVDAGAVLVRRHLPDAAALAA